MQPHHLLAGAGALLAVLVAAAPATSATWSDPVRIGGGLGDPSVAVDGSGRAHVVARGDDGIWYLVRHGGTWTRTRIARDREAEPDGRRNPFMELKVSPRIAHDPVTGDIVVAFLRFVEDGSTPSSPSAIRYRVLRNGSWSRVRSIPGAVDSNLSLAVRDGTIAVAYETGLYESRTIVFTTNASGSWTTRTFGDRRPLGPRSPSLTFDGAGRPHLAYTQGQFESTLPDTEPRIRYARGATPTGPFTKETVAIPDAWVHDVAIALGPNGPRIAFATDDGMWLARRAAGSAGWVPEPVVADATVFDVDLELRAGGSALILHSGPSTGLLAARKAGGAWVSDQLDDRSESGGDLVLAPNGTARVVFARNDRTWFVRSY